MPVFLTALLRSTNFYVYLALAGVIGTLYFLNARQSSKIEDYVLKIAEMESKAATTQDRIERQNDRIERLSQASAELKIRLENAELVAELLAKKESELLSRSREEVIENSA